MLYRQLILGKFIEENVALITDEYSSRTYTKGTRLLWSSYCNYGTWQNIGIHCRLFVSLTDTHILECNITMNYTSTHAMRSFSIKQNSYPWGYSKCVIVFPIMPPFGALRETKHAWENLMDPCSTELYGIYYSKSYKQTNYTLINQIHCYKYRRKLTQQRERKCHILLTGHQNFKMWSV